MANLYYDLYLSRLGVGAAAGNVALFAGGGMGLVNFEIDDEDDSVFGYNVAGGLHIDITDRIGLNFRYLWIASEDPEFDNIDSEYSSHNLLAGLRFTF